MAMPAGTLIHASEMVVTDDPDVQRTSWDDGAKRQQRVYTESYTVHRLTVHLPTDEVYETFRSWARREAHTWFAWPTPTDGVARRVRVRGGRGGITYESSTDASLRRWWTARFEVEGLPSASV